LKRSFEFGREGDIMPQDDTKSRLLESAGEEFAEKGFEGATIRGIIERARANIAAVNYHFGDKERLYVQAVIEAHRCGVVDTSADDGLLDGQSAGEQLRVFVRNFLSRVLAVGDPDSWHRKLMLREMIRPTQASAALVRDVIRPTFDRLLDILRRACPDADERRLTAAAFSVIGQCLHYKMGRPIAERLIGAEAFAAMDLDYLADHIATFSLAALGLGPPIGCEDWAAQREDAR
jgi:TetR/AcrR family transcriptional regulator, regulator of cefoperazone and chloramphenicol sensitivity